MTLKPLTIHVLGPERHTGWASVWPTSALANLIDENAHHVMAYIKPFPPNSRGLFGEICRHYLATGLSISTPPKIWVHLLSPERAREAWPDKRWPDAPILSFASAEIIPDITDCQFNSDNPTLVEMLLNWPMLWPLIALDTWLNNIDSNISNLIWTGDDFVAIDGAECFGGQYWTATQLENPAYTINKLAELIGAIDDLAPSKFALKKIHVASRSHSTALTSCESQLQHWHRLLIGPDECYAAIEFLWHGIKETQIH